MVLPYKNEDYGAKNITELLDVSLLNLTNGEVLKYNSSNENWENEVDTDTTYNAGTGVTINGSNEISIGQPVANTDSPEFTQLTIGNTGSGQGVLNMQDFTTLGTDTLVQQRCVLQPFTTDGGRFEIEVKEDGGALVERFVILNNGYTIVNGVLFAIQGIETTAVTTTDNPSSKSHIGWNSTQDIPSLGSNIPSDGSNSFKRLGSSVALPTGVFYLRGEVTIDPNGNTFFYNATIKEVGGAVLSTNRHKIWGYSWMDNVVTHILVIPPLTTKDIEFGASCTINFGAGVTINPPQPSKFEIIRIA